jgi:L-fuconate dehydratase
MSHIRNLIALDIRAPTSRTLAGSDAVHGDPDYSAAYVILQTDDARGLAGHGMTFTIGRGNDICVAAIQALAHHVVGRSLASIVADMAGFHRALTNDSQLRWLGPEKGVIHLATAAIVNAVWDLWGKVEAKPVWKLVADLTPAQLIACIDFRYLTDVLPPDRAHAKHERPPSTKGERETQRRRHG